MTLVQTEPKKICMWGNPPAPIVEYDQGEGTIVVQRRDIFTGTITESGTYTFQAALKSTSNWTSHLILYVNGNETVHFMKAGADGFLGFSKDVTLNSGDSVRIYGYHDLSGEVAYVAGTKLFKAELEPVSSSISGTVSTGSPLYAVYNLSNPTPGVYRWNVGSRSNSNGVSLYKSINGGAGELIASMTDGSYVDVQVGEGTTGLSLFYSMGSGSSTNISGGSVTVYPDSSSLVEREIKKITIRPNGVERQIRPAGGGGWQPGANTLCRYTFDNTLVDASGNHADASNMSSCTFVEAYTGSTKKVLNKPNGSYISLPATFLQTAVSEYTMIFWFKSTQTGQVWLMGCNGSNNIGGYPGNVLGGIDDNTYKRFGFLYGRDYDKRRIARNASTYRDGNWHLMSIRRGTGDVIVGIDKNYTTIYELNTPSDYSIGGNGIRRGIGTRSTDSGGGINTTSVFQLGDFITEDKYRADQDVSDYYDQTKGDYGL